MSSENEQQDYYSNYGMCTPCAHAYSLIFQKKGCYNKKNSVNYYYSYNFTTVDDTFIFTNNEHVLLRILVTNLCVICLDIYAIPNMCTPYNQSRLSCTEICLVNILTFSA